MSGGPLPGVLRPVTTPLSWGYRAVICARNRRFDDPEHVRHLSIPVLSVGNITTGGTGKTPLVMWIVEQLLHAGHRPVIAMRGYGARPGELSDEEAEYMQRFAQVPVVVNPDRHAGVSRYLETHPEIDCAVLDDGFQHRQLHRDLDLVTIDATCDTPRDRLLPAGNLREPLHALQRADAVIVTRSDGGVDEQLHAAITRYHGAAPLAWCRHHWAAAEQHTGGKSSTIGIDALSGLTVGTLLGVGNPQAVAVQIRRAGATIAIDIPVRDHQHYHQRRLTELSRMLDRAGAEALVTTGKDWVKLSSLIDWSQWTLPVLVPQVSIEFLTGEDEVRGLVTGCRPTLTPTSSQTAGDGHSS